MTDPSFCRHPPVDWKKVGQAVNVYRRCLDREWAAVSLLSSFMWLTADINLLPPWHLCSINNPVPRWIKAWKKRRRWILHDELEEISTSFHRLISSFIKTTVSSTIDVWFIWWLSCKLWSTTQLFIGSRIRNLRWKVSRWKETVTSLTLENSQHPW